MLQLNHSFNPMHVILFAQQFFFLTTHFVCYCWCDDTFARNSLNFQKWQLVLKKAFDWHRSSVVTDCYKHMCVKIYRAKTEIFVHSLIVFYTRTHAGVRYANWIDVNCHWSHLDCCIFDREKWRGRDPKMIKFDFHASFKNALSLQWIRRYRPISTWSAWRWSQPHCYLML